jgi:tRNA nucleotidyltransferase (CCA-adding enzyme)
MSGGEKKNGAMNGSSWPDGGNGRGPEGESNRTSESFDGRGADGGNGPLKLITGHSNMDLDSIASMVLARLLYPDHQAVGSRLVHPAAGKLKNLYEHHLGFLHAKELDGRPVERLVVVDTSSRSRVKEVLDHTVGEPAEVEIWDHHPAEAAGRNGGDGRGDGSKDSFPGATVHRGEYGANTTLLGLELMERGIRPTPEEATVALAGIYADTGNFTHENVTDADFEVAAYLLDAGASLKMVRTFQGALADAAQISVFHELLNHLEYRSIHGHRVVTSYLETEDEWKGLGAVVDKIFEVENRDIYFAVFSFPRKKKCLIIARNQKDTVPLHEILRDFGGGGHAKAAAATVKHQDGQLVYDKLLENLEHLLVPAITVEEIMSSPVHTVSAEASLFEASRALEQIGHTGMPVVDGEERLVGFLTLRDIMKGRRAEQMHAPVKGYMSRRPISLSPDAPVREVEELLAAHNIGHLPVVHGDAVAGIVTRSDYLAFKEQSHDRRRAVLESIGIE